MNITDAVKRHVNDMLGQLPGNRCGTVSSVNPAAAEVKLKLQPDDVETGWLPVLSTAIGAGWGVVWLPNVGDQAVAIPHDGSADDLIVIGFLYSDQQVPPQAPANEGWFVHQSGSSIKLTNAGGIMMVGATEISMTAGGHNVTINSAGVVIDGGIYGLHQHISEAAGTPTSAPIAGT